jgi:ABC-type transport system substrate-binding protein
MKKTLAILLALALCLGLLAGCSGGSGGGSDAPAADDGERTSITLAESSQWWGADCVLLDGTSFGQCLIQEPLVALDDDGNMVPAIAEAINVSEDGLTITLTIPKGMYFASGEELLPEDVKASLDRFKAVAPFADNLAAVESIDIDGQDVILKLSEFSSDISCTLSGTFITVQDKDVLDSTSDDDLLWGARPYGPYYISEYVEGSHVVLTRNDKYWTNNPNVKNKGPLKYEQITVRFIPEEFTMANALNIDDIQGTYSLSLDGVAQLTRSDVDVKTFVNIPNINYIEFNCHDGLMTDRELREAIVLLCDRDRIKEDNSDRVIPAYSFVTEGIPNKSDEFESYFMNNYNTNVPAAKQKLEDLGWADSDGDGYLDKDGQTLELLIVANDDVIENNTCQSLQIQFKEAGVKLNIETYADYGHYDVIAEGNYDLGLEHFGWQEPVLLLQYALSDEANFDVFGITDEYFENVSKVQHTVDYDERTQYVDTAEHYLADNWITCPLYTDMTTMVFTPATEGIIFQPSGMVYHNDMGF